MKVFYFVVETDDPRDEGFAFKDLDYYLNDFNDGEEYRQIYTIKEINE